MKKKKKNNKQSEHQRLKRTQTHTDTHLNWNEPKKAAHVMYIWNIVQLSKYWNELN